MFQMLADWLTYDVLGFTPESSLGSSVNFFLYDTPKILTLLLVIIFAVSLLRSYFPPEKTKRILSHKREFFGNISAALLGIVTPFCSCSAVPLYMGFLESGVPLGVTFSFLISSPMVNEVAVVLLWGMFGWQIALFYMFTGVTVAIVAGYVIGKLHLEHLIEPRVFQGQARPVGIGDMTGKERFIYARDYTLWIFSNVWIYVVVAVALGGLIHGYAPENFLAAYAGKDSWYAVPLAVLIGVPLYSNAAGIIPIVYSLMEKGVSAGTVLAFMMAVTALSFPEMIILRNVIKPKLIGIFVGIVSVTIILTGYLFNAIL